ncbi:sugar phosphate isomerase/epimerase family protein [Leifsonia shinshuensis]|uniref:sugar phosphate isomerase/epimerase family protein n=1 Tax=Leifsonia shinshuensis TaxID=150026 RepID=UPI002856D89E|nr:sugar phosphate isomerase/epimerase family protein [Leifsonia shinshuensis]MDR6972899.1 sugar phosphate isomerase/epimerase [Leifsonia shinshuensis]
MNLLSVSSYSVREQLGPASFSYVDGEGAPQTLVFDFPKVVELADYPAIAAQRFGVRAVEAAAFQFTGVEDANLDLFAASARSAGVELLNIAVDTGDLLQTDLGKRTADITELKTWIARCADLGFRFVRINPGSPFSAHHGEVPPRHLVEALVELGRYAGMRGVRLLVENHGGPSSDPAWMNALLDSVGPESLGLLLDLGNFDTIIAPLMAAMLDTAVEAPTDPFAGIDLEPVYEGIKALAGRAELVHVKAHRVGDDGTVGIIDLPRALAILSAHQYEGPLTVEYEGDGGDPWGKTYRVLQLTASVTAG